MNDSKALGVTLADGPHRLSTPGWAEVEYVQAAGFPVGVFARSTTNGPDMVAEAIREARIAAMAAVAPEDPADRPVITAEQVVEAISAINPPYGAVMDYGSIRAHLTALMRAAEPDEGWTDARVAAIMRPADVYRYTEILNALFNPASPAPANELGEG